MDSRLRIVVWNLRRATRTSRAWTLLLELRPDVALLQEVASIPVYVASQYDVLHRHATGKRGSPQRFGNAVLVRGATGAEIQLRSEPPWVEAELQRFSGNMLACEVYPANGERLCVVSVYSPAWPLDRSLLAGLDIVPVKLTQNDHVWPSDLLRASLSTHCPPQQEPWAVGGDFNLSETFDSWRKTPRGNREYLDRMTACGFTECLREHQGALTPTFRNPRGGACKHQMDHLFTTAALTSRLLSCTVGPKERVCDNSLSDHLPIIADFAPCAAV